MTFLPVLLHFTLKKKGFITFPNAVPKRGRSKILLPLADGFVEEDGGGDADVQGVEAA